MHAALLGCPLAGDATYGPSAAARAVAAARPGWEPPPRVRAALAALEAGGQLLHARALGFDHPASGAAMRFEVPPSRGPIVASEN